MWGETNPAPPKNVWKRNAKGRDWELHMIMINKIIVLMDVFPLSFLLLCNL
jgi:hypothetical protein